MLGVLGVDLNGDRAAIDGGSVTGGPFRVHGLKRLLARSHVLLGGKTLDYDSRALIEVVKELDAERDDALRRPPLLLDASLETLRFVFTVFRTRSGQALRDLGRRQKRQPGRSDLADTEQSPS